ncbi:MAG: hypothetical protein EZS28_021260 [Streblomastix strix]|uniref:Uncharacterized protein n=1 Tax=Streblomastix strix TaxID=222440 RepID=A0A5J4VLV4_9EUKA|nr:MAG: hypothetical protein EZS28_021260 [Streblomastix strix]
MILTIDTSLPTGTPLYINQRDSNLSSQFPDSKLVTNYVLNAGTPTSFAGVTSGNIQINATATSYDDGLRISRIDSYTGNATIQLGCGRTSNTGAIVGQWTIFTPLSSSETNPQGFTIAVSSQAGDNTRGLQISADGNTVYGIFTAPTKVNSYYDIDYGVNQLFHNHSRSGTSAIYSVYIRLEQAGNITIVVSDQSTYYTNRITERLTKDVVSGVINGIQIPITYDLANGGIINNMLQVNPTGRTYTTFNNGIRIGNYNSEYSSLYLGCDTIAINTTKAGQWEISKTNDNALTINPQSLRQADHSVGLSIISDSSTIKFNGNELVNVGTDQTITGRKTFINIFQIKPTDVSYGEEIRIANTAISNLCAVYIGTSPTNTSGEIADQWTIFKRRNGSMIICRTADQNTANKGLMISADGNTLYFNGSIIAGTGATSGASNGSVNYSAGNPILWGMNSTDPIGEFYSDGAKVQWRAHPLTMGSVPP